MSCDCKDSIFCLEILEALINSKYIKILIYHENKLQAVSLLDFKEYVNETDEDALELVITKILSNPNQGYGKIMETHFVLEHTKYDDTITNFLTPIVSKRKRSLLDEVTSENNERKHHFLVFTNGGRRF